MINVQVFTLHFNVKIFQKDKKINEREEMRIKSLQFYRSCETT